MVVDEPRAPTRPRPVPLHPPTRRLRAMVKAAVVGVDQPTWKHFAPFVQQAATHDKNGVPLRRSSRRAAHVGNIKRVFRCNAFNAVAEGLYD
jgi:hypothetical protein